MGAEMGAAKVERKAESRRQRAEGGEQKA